MPYTLDAAREELFVAQRACAHYSQQLSKLVEELNAVQPGEGWLTAVHAGELAVRAGGSGAGVRRALRSKRMARDAVHPHRLHVGPIRMAPMAAPAGAARGVQFHEQQLLAFNELYKRVDGEVAAVQALGEQLAMQGWWLLLDTLHPRRPCTAALLPTASVHATRCAAGCPDSAAAATHGRRAARRRRRGGRGGGGGE